MPYASVAARASGVSIYLFGIYCDPSAAERLAEAWKATGNRLDMGKSCIRVKKLDQIPFDVLGKLIKQMTAARFLKAYEASVLAAGKKKAAKKTAKKAGRKPAKKTTRKPAKKAAAKSTKKAAKKTARKPAKRTRR